MYYLGMLWLGALFGWLACSMLVRRSLEIENNHLRQELNRKIGEIELVYEARDRAVSNAYEMGKRDGRK